MPQSSSWQAGLREEQSSATCRTEQLDVYVCSRLLCSLNVAVKLACEGYVISRNRCKQPRFESESIPCEIGYGRCRALESESGRDTTAGHFAVGCPPPPRLLALLAALKD